MTLSVVERMSRSDLATPTAPAGNPRERPVHDVINCGRLFSGDCQHNPSECFCRSGRVCSPLDRLMVDGLIRVGKQYGGKTGERNPIAQIRPLKRIWDLSSLTISI